MSYDSEEQIQRDSKGRSPGAPAWSGDLRTLSPHNLDRRDESLSRHIANLTLKYDSVAGTWRKRDLKTTDIDRWIEQLRLARTEAQRRQDAVGLHEYLTSINDPATMHRPWAAELARAGA